MTCSISMRNTNRCLQNLIIKPSAVIVMNQFTNSLETQQPKEYNPFLLILLMKIVERH
jgi:hypothetical protein